MKIVKKMLIMVLSIMLIFTAAVPAMAAGASYDLTINGTDGVTQMKMYKLVNVEESATNPGKLTYSLNSKYNEVFTALGVTTVKELSQESVKDILDACESKITDLVQADQTATMDGKTSSQKFEDIMGYYYITMAGDQGTIYNPMFVTVPDNTGTQAEPVYQNAEVTAKKNKPAVDKKVKEGNDYGEAADAGIGEIVEYKVTADVPKYAENVPDNDVVFKMIDTLSQGITWVPDQQVTVETTDGTAIPGAVKSVTPSSADKVITIEFDYSKVKSNTQIVVKYEVIVNSNAVISGTGNDNTVKLEYTTDHKTDTTGESEPDNAKVFSYGLKVIKAELGNSSIVLAGAEFTLKKGNADFYFTKSGNVYKALNSDIYNVTKEENGTFTAVPKDKYSTLQTVTGLTDRVISDNSGNIVIDGLDAGDYTLKEVKAPDGYFIVNENIQFTITGEKIEAALTGKVATGSSTGNEAGTADGYYHKTVYNSTVYVLPETGDTGTIVMLTAGAVILAAGCIFLYMKRRKEA